LFFCEKSYIGYREEFCFSGTLSFEVFTGPHRKEKGTYEKLTHCLI